MNFRQNSTKNKKKNQIKLLQPYGYTKNAVC